MRKFYFSSIIILSALVMFGCNPTPPQPDPDPTPTPAKIVINEAYSGGKNGSIYGGELDLDWVELYNSGDLEGDVSGFMLYDKEDKTEFVVLPAGTKIAGKGFLLVVVDVEGGFGLSSGGDKVFLEDAAGAAIDQIEFGALTPDQAYARKPDGSATFAVQTPTPSASNNAVVANPAISNFSQQPASPSDEDEVLIVVSIVAVDGELTAKSVEWKVDDAAKTPVAMVEVDGVNQPNAYKATLPAQEAGAVVEFSIIAENSAGGRTVLEKTYIVRNALVINEVDGNGKFVELYNNSASAISLADVTLVKNESSEWWRGGADVSIAAGGYYTIAQNGGAAGADEYTGDSGISPKKTVKFELKAEDGRLIDQFVREKGTGLDKNCTPDYGSTDPQYSFSRCPDGTGNFGLAVPSCNAANPATAAGAIVTE